MPTLRAERHTRQRRQEGGAPQLVGLGCRGLPASGSNPAAPNKPSLPVLLLLETGPVLLLLRWARMPKAALLRAATGATAGRRAACSIVAVCRACNVERRQHWVPSPALQGSVALIAKVGERACKSPASRPLAASRCGLLYSFSRYVTMYRATRRLGAPSRRARADGRRVKPSSVTEHLNELQMLR